MFLAQTQSKALTKIHIQFSSDPPYQFLFIRKHVCKPQSKATIYPRKDRVNKPIKDGGSTAGLPPCNKPKDQQSN